MPSTHRNTGSRSPSDRVRQISYSACHPAFNRATEAADSPEPPPQGEIEVAEGEPVPVQSGEQLPHGLRPALEQGQQLALEPLGQSADARPSQRDRADAQAQPARLPVAVAIAGRVIDALTPGVASASQHRRDLVLRHALQQVLHPLPGEGLQALPHRP
jgi:hypothetical protein